MTPLSYMPLGSTFCYNFLFLISLNIYQTLTFRLMPLSTSLVPHFISYKKTLQSCTLFVSNFIHFHSKDKLIFLIK